MSVLRVSSLRVAAAALLAAGLISLGACSRGSVLLSESVEEPGLIYYLPKTVATLEIKAFGRLVEQPPPASIKGAQQPPDPEKEGPKRYEAEIESIVLHKVTTTEIADRSRGYSLYYEASAASHDRVCMGINDRGLLSSVEVAADDKTGDIIVSLAKLVGRLIGPTPFATKSAPGEANLVEIRTLTLDIDPLDRTHWDQVNKAMLATFGPIADRYRFKVEDADQLIRDAANPAPCPPRSVCYRTRVPVRFMLTNGKGPVSSMYKEVINRRVTGTIDVTRALMVEKITRLTFTDGVLIGANIKKPSEGLAVAKLPLTVMDAIVTSMLAAPGDFIGKAAGLPSQTAVQLIQDTTKNAAQVEALQKSLAAIRAGDLSPDTPVVSGDGFQLRCTTPGSTNPKPSPS